MIIIGKVVGKTYENPKEFLEDFEIEAIVKDNKTTDYIKEIFENAKAIHISINLSEELLDEEVLDKIDELYDEINERMGYSFEICPDDLSDILDNVEKGLSNVVASYIINLLKELKLNKLIFYNPSSKLIPYQLNPPSKHRAPIDESVQRIYSLIKENKLTYEVSIPLLYELNLKLPNKYLPYEKICNVISPLNEIFSEEMIEDGEFEKYKEEYEKIIEFYRRLNHYLRGLFDKLDKKAI